VACLADFFKKKSDGLPVYRGPQIRVKKVSNATFLTLKVCHYGKSYPPVAYIQSGAYAEDVGLGQSPPPIFPKTNTSLKQKGDTSI